MRIFLFNAVVIFIFQGCIGKIEVPFRHAGVVVKGKHVNPEVLKPGEHWVSWRSTVVNYDVSSAKLDSEFDFLFSNASRGDLRIVLEFQPVADSLPSFYKKFESRYVEPVFHVSMRQVVRALFLKFRPDDLTQDEFKAEIAKAIKANPEMANYIEVRKVDIVELKY